MSAAQYRLRLADGRIVTGPIQGCGGTIPSGQVRRIQIQIDRANAGEALGFYEPAPGCVSLRYYNPNGPDRHETIDLRGAVLLGEYDPPRCGCAVNAPEADPAAFPCPCGDHCADPACVAARVPS